MTEPPTDADLAALLDQERGLSAARARGAQRWLRQQGMEEARLSGVALSAAEQHDSVTIRTTSGRAHTGVVTVVGADFLALHSSGGVLVYLAMRAVALLQSDRALAALPAGDGRSAPVTTTLQNALADLAGERPEVAVVSEGNPQPVPGQLLAVGLDVLSLAVAGQRTIAYVSMASLTELSLRSG